MTLFRRKKVTVNTRLVKPSEALSTKHTRSDKEMPDYGSDDLFSPKRQPGENTKVTLVKSMLGLLLGITTLIMAVGYLYYWLMLDKPSVLNPVPSHQPMAETSKPPNQVTQQMAHQIASTTTAIEVTNMTDTNTAASVSASSVTPETVANAPIPADGALVAEEIDLLDDQFLRLSEQEALKQAQLAAIKELADKKAERIRLLEQQIAQLEQQQANKPTSQ